MNVPGIRGLFQTRCWKQTVAVMADRKWQVHATMMTGSTLTTAELSVYKVGLEHNTNCAP